MFCQLLSKLYDNCTGTKRIYLILYVGAHILFIKVKVTVVNEHLWSFAFKLFISTEKYLLKFDWILSQYYLQYITVDVLS